MTKRQKTVALDGAQASPQPEWRIPAHVLATSQKPTPEQTRRMADAARAHSLMLSHGGALHPLVLTGYLAEPDLALEFFSEQTGGPVAPAARAEWGARSAELAHIAVYSGTQVRATDDTFNMFGSFLACDLGFTLAPLYGPVFFCRIPDPHTGAIAKLPGRTKDMIAFKFVTAQAIFEGVRLDYIDEDSYKLAWARVRELVRAHEQRCVRDVGEIALSPSP